jgi:hypothetical protein
MSTFYVGQTPQDILGYGLGPNRFFYALRRTEEGDLFFSRLDQLTDLDVIQVNAPGDSGDDWEFFEIGIDFVDGRDKDTRERPFKNLIFDQYRWDSRNMFYYINEEGELVVRINQPYTYPEDV